jgi:hypothetical protein
MHPFFSLEKNGFIQEMADIFSTHGNLKKKVFSIKYARANKNTRNI